MFSLLTEVVAIPQVSLECSQLLGRFIRLCLLHPRRPRPGSSCFQEKRFRLFLPPCVCEDGLPAVREREREKRKLLSCSRGALLLHYSLLKRFFLCLDEKKLYFVL